MAKDKRKHVYLQFKVDRRSQKRRSVTYVAPDFISDADHVLSTTPTADELRYFHGWFTAVERSRFNVRRPFTVILTDGISDEEIDIAAVDQESAAAIANDLIRRGWYDNDCRVKRVTIL